MDDDDAYQPKQFRELIEPIVKRQETLRRRERSRQERFKRVGKKELKALREFYKP